MARSEPQSAGKWFVAVVVVFVVAFVVVPYALFLYSWRDATRRGPLVHRTSWPRPIQKLYSSMERDGQVSNSFGVYLLQGRPGDTDSTVVCRLPDSSAAFEFLEQHLELRPVAFNQQISRFTSELVRLAPPDWCAPTTDKTQWYMSRRFLEGDEGDLYVVARDAAAKRIYIHYHFNF